MTFALALEISIDLSPHMTFNNNVTHLEVKIPSSAVLKAPNVSASPTTG